MLQSVFHVLYLEKQFIPPKNILSFFKIVLDISESMLKLLKFIFCKCLTLICIELHSSRYCMWRYAVSDFSVGRNDKLKIILWPLSK